MINKGNRAKINDGCEESTMTYSDILCKTLSMIQCEYMDKTLEYAFAINKSAELFEKMRIRRKTIFFIGNGGSAGIAMHMTTDFLKNGRIRTHSMHDPTTLTCLGNDYGYEQVFSKQLEIVAEKSDMLVAISSSGNSPNIINAVNVAREKGCHVITLSGFKPDNRLRQLGDINIYVPSEEYGIVESIHNMILQQIVDEIMYKDREGAKE